MTIMAISPDMSKITMILLMVNVRLSPRSAKQNMNPKSNAVRLDRALILEYLAIKSP
jgi:hypothetical protein